MTAAARNTPLFWCWIAALSIWTSGCSFTFDPAGTLGRKPAPANYAEPPPQRLRPPPPRHVRGRPPAATAVHVVQPGESLSAIARTYRTTIGALVETNRLETARLVPGQRLVVPRRTY